MPRGPALSCSAASEGQSSAERIQEAIANLARDKGLQGGAGQGEGSRKGRGRKGKGEGARRGRCVWRRDQGRRE